MKYPPTAEEVEARHKDSYREQVNRSEIRCHGVSHPLDKYTVLRDKHYTLGIKRPLPTQLGATYKNYIRVGKHHWVNRDEVVNVTSVRLIHDEDI